MIKPRRPFYKVFRSPGRFGAQPFATVVTLLLWAGGCGGAAGQNEDETAVLFELGTRGGVPDVHWAAIEPEEARWSDAGLQEALSLADSLGSGALLVVDDGVIVAHTGAIDEAYQIASLRKSMLSILIGMAVDRDEIDLDLSLAELGIDDRSPSLSTLERTATVRDLITARSGVYHKAAYEPSSMRANRPARGSHAPGDFWFYNNWDFNTLGSIYAQATGLDVFSGFARDLAGPLQLEDYSSEGQEWVGHPATEHSAYVFRLSARDMARVGLLMMRRGRWNGEQVVSAGWVEESTLPHAEGRWGSGYGYMWWVPVEGRHYPGVRLPQDAFIGRGAGPHHMLIVPSLDLVVVHVAETNRPRPTRWISVDQVSLMFALILDARGFGPASNGMPSPIS